MARRGRKYLEARERVDRTRTYPPAQGFRLLKEIDHASYDATVECAFRLGVDPRKADQMVRGAIGLPHGTGTTPTVAVVASGTGIAEAQEAGADHVGGDDLVEKLEEGDLVEELDAVIATPDMMSSMGRLGRLLGPRGLMPNPKSGTVTMDVGAVVREIKAGRVEYRSDRNGNVHVVLGKISFGVGQLVENYLTLLEELLRQRPAAAKGRYVRNVTISTSVSPGIHLDPTRSRARLEDDEEEATAVA